MLFYDGPPIFVCWHNIEIEIMSRRCPKSKVYHVKRSKNNNQRTAVSIATQVLYMPAKAINAEIFFHQLHIIIPPQKFGGM